MEFLSKAVSWALAFAGFSPAIPDVVNHDMSSYDETDHTGIWDEELSPLVDDEEVF